MADVNKNANKTIAKKPKVKRTAQKPDKERWNKSIGGTFVDISKIEFVNKPKRGHDK